MARITAYIIPFHGGGKINIAIVATWLQTINYFKQVTVKMRHRPKSLAVPVEKNLLAKWQQNS